MLLIITPDLRQSKLVQKCNLTIQTINTAEYVCTNVHGVDFILADIGCTKVRLAMNLMLLLQQFNISCIIAMGNCGLLAKWGEFGEIAISSAMFQQDVRFMPIGYTRGTLPQKAGESTWVSSPKSLIEKAIRASQDIGLPCMTGNYASGDQFLANSEEASCLHENCNLSFVDSECGAVAEVACIYEIPMIAIKGVCNYADECAGEDFEEYHKAANANSEDVVMQMLKTL